MERPRKNLRRYSLSYDAEGDALSVHFDKPSAATDSYLTDDDVIIRWKGNEVIGLTILRASEHLQALPDARPPRDSQPGEVK